MYLRALEFEIQILSRLWTEGFYQCEISLLIYTDDIERKFCSNFCVWLIRKTTCQVDTLTGVLF